MTTFDRVLKVFTAVFEEEIDPASVTPTASLREDIGMNSIGMLYMAMALEEEFGIKFTNDDLMSLVTVGDVLRTIEEK